MKLLPSAGLAFLLSLLMLCSLGFADSNWWNTSWEYRKPINMSIVINANDFPLFLNLNYSDGMASDFRDIRFTNASGYALPYYIEDKEDGQWANVYVKGNYTTGIENLLFVYYNCTNNCQSESDPSKAASFYDDFDDNYVNTSVWSNISLGSGGNATWTETDGMLYMRAGSDSSYLGQTKGLINQSMSWSFVKVRVSVRNDGIEPEFTEPALYLGSRARHYEYAWNNSVFLTMNQQGSTSENSNTANMVTIINGTVAVDGPRYYGYGNTETERFTNWTAWYYINNTHFDYINDTWFYHFYVRTIWQTPTKTDTIIWDDGIEPSGFTRIGLGVNPESHGVYWDNLTIYWDMQNAPPVYSYGNAEAIDDDNDNVTGDMDSCPYVFGSDCNGCPNTCAAECSQMQCPAVGQPTCFTNDTCRINHLEDRVADLEDRVGMLESAVAYIQSVISGMMDDIQEAFVRINNIELIVSPQWDIKGNWTWVYHYGGDYAHAMNITSFNETTGYFSGTGYYVANPSYTWNITGNVAGDEIGYHLVYTGISAGFFVNGNGTINSAGDYMSGPARDSLGRSATWSSAGQAVKYE